MKKLQKPLLILMLICTILTTFGTTALAQEEKIFEFKPYQINSDDLTMTSTPRFDNVGWTISPDSKATIVAKREGITIKRIKAYAYRNRFFSFDMNVSSGTVEETDSSAQGWITINNINSDRVTIRINSYNIQFDEIVVYYTDDGSQSLGSVLSSGNLLIILGVATVAIFVVVAIVMVKKKKDTVA